MPAQYTAMNQSRIRAAVLNADWLHHSAAFSFAISGKHVDMPAPQAERAVIRKAVAFDAAAAVFAEKRLNIFLITTRHSY